MASTSSTSLERTKPSFIPNTMHPDIVKERKAASFNTYDMVVFIDGTEQETKKRRQMESILLQQPLYTKNTSSFGPEEEYDYCAKETITLVTSLRQNKLSGLDMILHARRAVTNDHLFGVHELMFVPTLERLGTEEQQAKWVPMGRDYKILGTYAQTELGHGTYLQGLETTATYDSSTQEFILNSPTLSSMKFWPGALGKVATHAVVMAQLIIQGKKYGPHAFIVQLRSLKDHKPLPGRTLGDIGVKWTHNGHANGYLRMDKVHIPRNHMLMKYAQVSPDGTYSKQGNIKIMYNTMILVRMTILTHSFILLGKALTIAVRYSAIRRQGPIQVGGSEVQLLDYQTQQQKLFPGLATAYAFNSVTKHMMTMYRNCNTDIAKGDFSSLPELHALASGLKSFMTWACFDFADKSRQCCGGHGYLSSSGLPSLVAKISASITYEGENSVMILQTARYLLKNLTVLQNGGHLTGSACYLSSPPQQHCQMNSKRDMLNFDFLIQAYQHRAYRLTMAAGERISGLIMQGKSQGLAWNNCTIDLTKASEAHIHYFTVETFCKEVESLDYSLSVKKVLTSLCVLYAVYGMEKNIGDFLQDGYMTGVQAQMIHEQYISMLSELRPDAISLVDAFDFHDDSLHTTLGCYDGNVYERLFADAQKSAKNKTEVHPIYHKYLKPLITKGINSKL